jgi:DNA polymerase IIIc chi subunit
MIKADIYTKISDPLNFMGRFLWQKVIVAKRNAVVLYDPMLHTSHKLSQSLWCFDDAAFIPHGAGIEAASFIKYPIVLLTLQELEDVKKTVNILINLMEHAIPEKVLKKHTQHLIEIVSLEPQDIQNARDRFRIYRDYHSVELRHHVLS